VIIRNVVHSTPDHNYRNLLFGIMHAGIPTLNSALSIYANLERPIMYGGLLSIQRRLGAEKFPLIGQYYYPNWKMMAITPRYPLVLKVSHVHSSLGKVRLQQHTDFEDMTSVIALHTDYCTAEEYHEGEYDLRIQKIGDHVRVLKRTGTGQWKTNRGASLLESVPVTEQYKLWIDEASKLFGGLDICALDVIHSTSGKEYILELNDTSIGLSPEHEEEDHKRIRDIAVKRLIEHYDPKRKNAEERPLPAVPYAGWQIEKLNLENSNEFLESKIKSMTAEINDFSEEMRIMRGQINRVKREKQQPVRRANSIFYGISIGVLVTCILIALLNPFLSNYFDEKK